MSKYEKLGNFLLFEELEEDKLSKNFLAGQIVNNQIQQINLVKKFDHSLSTMPDFILDLNQEIEILKSLANPSIVRPNSFVQEKSEFAAVFDYVEGKSLRAILNKCQQDGYPFTADHALLVASRLCTALEYLHSKKVNEERLLHGLVSPETIFVTYDGGIKLQYLGLAQVLIKFPAVREKISHEYKMYFAPETLNQNHKGSDIYGAGLMLYEMLTGDALFATGRDINVPQAIDNAEMFLASGERVAIPDDIKKVLQQALANDPAHRYAAIGDMRKALDQLLFTSEYSATTFNLAFFMHSLFRENIDEEIKSLANLRKIDVKDFIKEEPPAPRKVERPIGAQTAKDVGTLPTFSLGQQASESRIFGGAEAGEKSKTPLIVGVLIAVALLGTIGYFVFKPSTPAPQATNTTAALSPDQLKAQQAERAKLEAEAKKAEEEAKSKDAALKELQAKLDALMKQQKQKENSAAPPTDAAAIQKLQEQARKLEEEKKQQQALAEEKLKAAQAPATVVAPPTEIPPQAQQQAQPTEQKPTQMASATPPPVTQGAAVTSVSTTSAPEKATPTPTPVEAKNVVKEGDVVQLTPDVVKPEITKRVNPSYPPAALRQKIEGAVILSVLISESGDVADIKLLRGAGGASGLNEAAEQAVKKWKFRPAVKEGKRVKVWLTYPIVFKLQ